MSPQLLRLFCCGVPMRSSSADMDGQHGAAGPSHTTLLTSGERQPVSTAQSTEISKPVNLQETSTVEGTSVRGHSDNASVEGAPRASPNAAPQTSGRNFIEKSSTPQPLPSSWSQLPKLRSGTASALHGRSSSLPERQRRTLMPADPSHLPAYPMAQLEEQMRVSDKPSRTLTSTATPVLQPSVRTAVAAMQASRTYVVQSVRPAEPGDMQLSTSLSEPLAQSSSPDPDHQPPTGLLLAPAPGAGMATATPRSGVTEVKHKVAGGVGSSSRLARVTQQAPETAGSNEVARARTGPLGLLNHRLLQMVHDEGEGIASASEPARDAPPREGRASGAASTAGLGRHRAIVVGGNTDDDSDSCGISEDRNAPAMPYRKLSMAWVTQLLQPEAQLPQQQPQQRQQDVARSDAAAVASESPAGWGQPAGGADCNNTSTGVLKKDWEDASGPLMARFQTATGSTSRTPRNLAQQDVSQIAMLQMLHFGSASGRVPLHHLATLNVATLSREIRALHWIGQGGGGAVFQGVWQGAPVAVKFMLAARPEHVDATALEAIVSLAVGHPNVVTTYNFDVTRLTDASFQMEAEDAGRPDQPAAAVSAEDSSATALYNALMDSNASLEPGGLQWRPHQQQQHPAAVAGGSGARAGGGGNNNGGAATSIAAARTAAVSRVENLSMRVRRAQAAAAAATGSPNVTPTVEGDGAAAGDNGGGGGSGELYRVGYGPAAAAGSDQGGTPNQVHRAGQSVESGGMEAAFNSEDGFGDPDLADNVQSWTVRHVLAYLKARPGMFMTHMIMEYCDRGSLISAIKRGIFRTDSLPEDARGIHSGGGSAASSSRSVAGLAAAAAVAVPEPPRFSKRVVLRALLRTARDVAQGMSHLHANGIIHGDLKPGNVLLRGCRTDRRGFTALVSDFGLCKLTRGDKPLELNHWSTVTVMAPEVIMGRWLKASDVFSFGILLWQLVTGEIMPYGRCTVQQVLIGVSQGTLKPEWPASAHPALVRLGRACLATSPEKRPSFGDIVKILTKIEQNVRNELKVRRETAICRTGPTAIAALIATAAATRRCS